MMLKDYEGELAAFQAEINGEWVDRTENLLGDKSLSLGDNLWRFKIVEKTEDWDGHCNHKERLITIVKSEKKNIYMLLHEMIHAYEFMLEENCEMYKQFLLIDLYERLLIKVPDLKKKMKLDLHSMLRVHSPLFMLKSLDLDIRLNKPLGTVYAYGREEIFNDN